MLRRIQRYASSHAASTLPIKTMTRSVNTFCHKIFAFLHQDQNRCHCDAVPARQVIGCCTPCIQQQCNILSKCNIRPFAGSQRQWWLRQHDPHLSDFIQHGVELGTVGTDDIVNELVQQCAKRMGVWEQVIFPSWLPHSDFDNLGPSTPTPNVQSLPQQQQDP